MNTVVEQVAGHRMDEERRHGERYQTDLAYADSLYNGTCNQCHGAPEIAHFDANGWIGTLNGMIGFTSLDKREERTLLKYLQMNASTPQVRLTAIRRKKNNEQ